MKYVMLSAIVCAGVAPAGAAPTLDEAQGAAERAYPAFRIAEQERDVAAIELQGAEGGFDATWRTRSSLAVGYYDSLRADSVVEKPLALRGATVFAGAKLGVGAFPVYDQRLETLDAGELRAGLSLPLWRNAPIDRRRGALARARLAPEVADLTIAQQRLELRRAVAYRFWDWVAAGQRLVIADQLLAIARDRDAALAARVVRGDLPAIERTDNARAIEQRTAQVAAARRGVERAAIELALFVGEDSAARWALLRGAAVEFPPEVEGTPAVVANRRPEPRRLALQARQQSIDLAVAENQLAPALDVQLLAAQDLGPSKATRPDLSVPQVEVGLVLDIPIERNALRARRDAAALAVRRTQLQLELTRMRIEAEVQDASSARSAALARIEAARQEVELARLTEEAEVIRFGGGDSNLLLVNLREQQTAEARSRLVDARLEYRRALADLEAARGGT